MACTGQGSCIWWGSAGGGGGGESVRLGSSCAGLAI